jgi:hypothetical protein
MVNPNAREEKNVGVREEDRRISNETNQFAQAATDVGEAAIRAGIDLLQRNSQVMEQFWAVGRNVASQLTDPSLNPLFRGFAKSDAGAQQAVEQAARNVEAVIGSGAVVAQELQNMSREWLEFAQSRFRQTLDSVNALGRCRTPHDAAALQSELMRAHVKHLLQSARRTAEISARMADQASSRIVEKLDRERQAA